MIIYINNKDKLIAGDFNLKCCIGKKGISNQKKEGDQSTPKGIFALKKLYFRKDRVGKIKSKISKRTITKDMAWCDDPSHKKYNKEIRIYTNNHKERLYRKDNKYDYLITLNHNHKGVPHKGSAIFIHLTTNYKPTAGCIALKRKDFEVLLKLINNKTKIKIG